MTSRVNQKYWRLILLINIFGPPPKLFYFCFVVLVHWRGWGGCQRGGGAGQGHVPRPQPHVAEQRGHLWPRGPRLPRPVRGGHLQGLDHSDVWRYRQQTSKRNPGYNLELPTKFLQYSKMVHKELSINDVIFFIDLNRGKFCVSWRHFWTLGLYPCPCWKCLLSFSQCQKRRSIQSITEYCELWLTALLSL